MAEQNRDTESPTALARRIVEAWPSLTDEERTEVATVLAKVLPIPWKGYGPPSRKSDAPDPDLRPAWIETKGPDGSRGIRLGWVPVERADDDQ